MAFSKICDDRGKLGKGQKETGAKGRKREETRQEGMGIIWLSIFATSGEEEGGRSYGGIFYKEGEKSGEKQLGAEMQPDTFGCTSKSPNHSRCR